MNRLLPLFFLFSCHLIAADDAIIDRCSLICSQYMVCMENNAGGKPEMAPCVKPMPPCSCRPIPEIEPRVAVVNHCEMMCTRYMDCLANQAEGRPDVKTCLKPMPPCQCPHTPEVLSAPCINCNEKSTQMPVNPIIHECDVACERYSKCRQQMPQGPCVPPTGCTCAQPDRAIVMPMLPNLCTPCFEYWRCRLTSMGRPTARCARPKECTCDMHTCFIMGFCETDNMPEQLNIEQKVPCMKPDCNPDEESNQPMKTWCDMLCETYQKCLGESKPQGSCMQPPASCKCSGTPRMAVQEHEEQRPIRKCMEPCKFYWECRLGGGHLEKPNLACPKPPGCMCDCVAAGICEKRDIVARIIEVIPREEHCAIEVCGQYWNCQVAHMDRPETASLECAKPQGCKCECIDEGFCALEHFMPDEDEKMPEGVPAVVTEQCSNEKCADYWMCSWMAVPDDKFTCVKPQGCRCSCADAGICARADITEIARLAAVAEDVAPPRREPIHELKCAYSCARFSLCLKLHGGDRCHLTAGCNCEMQLISDKGPKQPSMGD